MQFSALFSYMLWHIELKFCIWLFFTVLQIKFECRQFPSIFIGVMPLLECRILKIQFSTLFSYMLWLIELKFCISLCFTILQIKFECPQFASIFVGVMTLLEYRILKIHSFPHFSLYTLWHIDLKFCILLCFTVLQIKFECCQFPSNFVGVMSLLDLEYWKIHSFPHFSFTCFDISGLNFTYDFVLLYYRSSSSVVNFRHFLMELYPFRNVEYWKFTVFRTFLLHALTY